jgi:hypothetical protein
MAGFKVSRIVLAVLLTAAAMPADAQYYPYPRRYANERPPPPPQPPRPYPRPCWNCGQHYPSNVPSCPYCYSPRDKPR